MHSIHINKVQLNKYQSQFMQRMNETFLCIIHHFILSQKP